MRRARFSPSPVTCHIFKGAVLLKPIDQAREIAEIISDKKGSDIVLLDTGKVSTIADYFVIATAESERQAKAMVDEIEKKMKQHRKLPLSVDGEMNSGWVLLDYGGVIVHIFDPGTRDYYDLEDLWSNAPVLVRMQ
ncbi:MAG: ribosome silencing factor [Chloroflexi bacterium]|nr:ribosome silencing factor [Chloroflexota bacterium]